MAQKMTLSAYLQQRGKKAKALTRIEAQVFDVPFPLQSGWPRRYGAMEITPEMIERIEAHAAEASQSDDRTIRRSAKRAAAALPVAETAAAARPTPPAPALVGASKAAGAPSFPGFALRPAKRRRSRESAPWA